MGIEMETRCEAQAEETAEEERKTPQPTPQIEGTSEMKKITFVSSKFKTIFHTSSPMGGGSRLDGWIGGCGAMQGLRALFAHKSSRDSLSQTGVSPTCACERLLDVTVSTCTKKGRPRVFPGTAGPKTSKGLAEAPHIKEHKAEGKRQSVFGQSPPPHRARCRCGFILSTHCAHTVVDRPYPFPFRRSLFFGLWQKWPTTP